MPGLLNSLKLTRPKLARPHRGNDGGVISVDLGSEAVRATQIDGTTLLARGSAEVAPHLCGDFGAYVRHLPDLLVEATTGGFVGRRVALSLPSSRVHWATLRLPKLDAAGVAEAIRFEASDKLPIDVNRAILRHEVAGEVATKDGPRIEVLISAALRSDVEAVLAAAEKAGLEPVALQASPLALRAGIARYYDRVEDPTTTFCCVDLGRRSTRLFVVRGDRMIFARPIEFGVETVYEQLAEAQGCDVAEVRRRRVFHVEPPKPAQETEGMAMLGAAMRRHADKPAAAPEDASIASHAAQLASEVTRCRQYHDATFASHPIDRLIFFGGGARDEALCRDVARRVGVAAQVGDFACRLAGEASGLESGTAAAWSLSLGLAAGVPAVRPTGA